MSKYARVQIILGTILTLISIVARSVSSVFVAQCLGLIAVLFMGFFLFIIGIVCLMCGVCEL